MKNLGQDELGRVIEGFAGGGEGFLRVTNFEDLLSTLDLTATLQPVEQRSHREKQRHMLAHTESWVFPGLGCKPFPRRVGARQQPGEWLVSVPEFVTRSPFMTRWCMACLGTLLVTWATPGGWLFQDSGGGAWGERTALRSAFPEHTVG